MLRLLAFFFLLPSYSYAQVLAKVGNQTITVEEFKKEFQKVKDNIGMLPFEPTPEQFLEDMIRYRIGLQEANRKKITKIPEVKKKLEQELYKALLEVELAKKVEAIKIKDSEVSAFYNRYPNIRTSHILIRYPADATPTQIQEARQRAQTIYGNVVKSNRPFRELVRLYSEDEISKASDGDIGFQSVMTLHPAYYEAARKLKQGQIAGPIQTRFGFHILQLTGIQPFSDANKEQVRVALFDDKRKNIVDNYFKELKRKYPISVNTEALK